MPTITLPKIDASKAFQFLYVQDTGESCCPHCGAEGRYVYHWAEFGQVRAAMAGCYSALTGRLKKDDFISFMEILSRKQAAGKPLNGWQKTVIRMNEYIVVNSNDDGKVAWANQKIREAVADQKRYAFKKFSH